VFSSLFDEGNTRAALPSIFARIYAALCPGVLLVSSWPRPGSCPGAAAAPGQPAPIWAVLAENHEEGDLLTRRITSFRERGAGYGRSEEVHRQRLYRAGDPGAAA
jgi:hypothetical protein